MDNLPFDSFDLEALDRLAQGGGEPFDPAQDREPVEWPVERLVEPFGICVLLFEIFYDRNPNTDKDLITCYE